MFPALLLAALAPGAFQEAPAAPAQTGLAPPDALHLAIVLDDSGSMLDPMAGSGRSKMEVAKTALREVFAALPAGARVGVFTLNPPYGGTGTELLPIAAHDADAVAAALGGVEAGGGTPLGERLNEATAALLLERAARRYGDYRLLVVTDGEATDGGVLDAAVPRTLGAGLTVDVIGVAMAGDHTLATAVDRYRRADDPQSLREALEEVVAESTGSSADGAETDYDLIAGLPEGAAAVALRALSDPPAETETAPNEPDADGAFVGNPPPPANPPSANPAPPAPVPFEREELGGDDDDWIGGLCCCLLPLVGAAVAGFVAFKLLGAGGRRR